MNAGATANVGQGEKRKENPKSEQARPGITDLSTPHMVVRLLSLGDGVRWIPAHTMLDRRRVEIPTASTATRPRA